ncbi:YdeI/OmpD-associated family protein [Saccharospirillum salsuginis]|uniref:Bacteriocin-protection, YdeI or OmpD-Associated n=1 Tax=Saccharospirillum salsuginis TaxID=418750 RepID=A0A918K6A1_9GAMM|nr:YdeI/OmpD-associated family protein [Saccharospirillum salsuginis]GGX49066.1 hypothetical protein GCM10007392_15410 [Saccharospirillum salsuginis]
MTPTSNLKRPRHPMPDDIRLVLESRALMDDYRARPDYQQNDYIGWITRAKRPETREKRLRQMLDELERGGVYMKMAHPASRKTE